jgi:hypothetical protein
MGSSYSAEPQITIECRILNTECRSAGGLLHSVFNILKFFIHGDFKSKSALVLPADDTVKVSSVASL